MASGLQLGVVLGEVMPIFGIISEGSLGAWRLGLHDEGGAEENERRLEGEKEW